MRYVHKNIHKYFQKSLSIYLFESICLYIICSKLSREDLRKSIATVLDFSNTKKRRFTESVELQISLKNYDTQKDKRFSGTVKYELPDVQAAVMADLYLGS